LTVLHALDEIDVESQDETVCLDKRGLVRLGVDARRRAGERVGESDVDAIRTVARHGVAVDEI
jgi:hypothetical protein